MFSQARIYTLPLNMKAVLFLVILLHAQEITSNACPRHCTCKSGGVQGEGSKIKCTDRLKRIQEVDLNSVRIKLVQLDLTQNDINAIESKVFQNLTNLRHLSVAHNLITALDEGSFYGLENLERLDLSNNEITTIGSYTFKKLSKLKKLDLSGNKINSVEQSLFHYLIALDRLKLNGNRLSNLKEGTFDGLKALRQMDLSSNPWKCDCDLYWLYNLIHNSPIKLSPMPKCVSPLNLKGQFIKKLRPSEDFQCHWTTPAIEIRPSQNQVVFAGDSITLKCRAPSIVEDKNAKLNWLWYPNVTAEIANLNQYTDPQEKLSNIKIENRYLSDSGIVDSSLSIVPIKQEHNGQWNCLLISMHGNKSKTIGVIVISEETRYCPLAVTTNNKGVYTWPRTIVGWKVELPCEGIQLSDPTLIWKATYYCNTTGYWENLNTESCPYISHITKVLEQFSKADLSLAKDNLLDTAKRFKNYTEDNMKITDPVEINFIIQTIENYLKFLTKEKELGIILIDVINEIIDFPKQILEIAEILFKSTRRLIKAVETIIEFNPSIQSHKKNIALEEFRVKRDSFTGLTCTWYSSIITTSDSDPKLLHCATNNKSALISTKDKIIEASIQLPASLLQNLQGVMTHQLMISMYSDNNLFPKMNDQMDITTCIVGSKLIGVEVTNLTDPVYIMLKVPLQYYKGGRLKPVIWDNASSNKSSGWSSEGCQLSHLLNNLIVFQCNRLGYYGLVQDVSHIVENSYSITRAKFEYSSPAVYIGSSVAIACLIITSVTYIICYKSITMPKKTKHCVINTWLAMTLLCFLYTIGIQQTENIATCQAVGLGVHYLSLCCLFWMTASASNMYRKFSKPTMDIISDDELPDQPLPKPILGLYLVGWGIALIVCGISGAINLQEYAGYSYCFLTSSPALVALFVPAGILIVYLSIFHLLIRCSIQNVDLNAQLSEGTQATENMDLELLEPNTRVIEDRHSGRSSRSISSDIEDPEHSQINQLKGQIIMIILYLISWSMGAIVTAKPLSKYFPFEKTVFASVYALSSSFLGIFVLLFYGITRNDVRSQWLKLRCWFRRKKNACCRTRSVSDSNPVIPTQPLVQNLGPVSTSQATQVTSDTNSVTSSRNTYRSQICNPSKIIDNNEQDRSPLAVKTGNVNLVVLHRQQYRSNNSVTTYTEPTMPACVEMFYNPHQSGVARKFFRKQRRHTKNNNLALRKQGDRGSDNGSCTSIPRHDTRLESDILSSSSKVNNKNIHIELNPINDTKNVNILSDSGGSMSEERHIPIRFRIGQENLRRNIKKVNNDTTLIQEEPVRRIKNESDTEIKTDEEKHLRNVSQQCSLEYSSEIESNTQMTSERSDHNLPEIGEIEENIPEECSINFEKESFRKTFGWAYYSNSMYCLHTENVKPLQSSYRNSLNDLTSLTSSKNCECSKPSLTDFKSNISCDLYDLSSNSQRIFSRSEHSLSEINSLTSDNVNKLVRSSTDMDVSSCYTEEQFSFVKCKKNIFETRSFDCSGSSFADLQSENSHDRFPQTKNHIFRSNRFLMEVMSSSVEEFDSSHYDRDNLIETKASIQTGERSNESNQDFIHSYGNAIEDLVESKKGIADRVQSSPRSSFVDINCDENDFDKHFNSIIDVSNNTVYDNDINSDGSVNDIDNCQETIGNENCLDRSKNNSLQVEKETSV